MAFRALRRVPTASRPAAMMMSSRPFHSTPRACVQVGDAVPDLDLHEGSPANKVNLAKAYGTGGLDRGVIIGVPAAFSGACSQKHVPSYINHPRLADAGQVFVVSVNDAFVMKAWGDQLDPTKESGVS
ncbi:putative thioredoxin-like fold [Rosellinia necatrix]|uniref:Putative thioredoxin-like fold n=1 Tax=Rosellinia necatrix TaxID=77044 RepID=A0A1S8A982_ROSNE|nr:putative thioredoxin-like fold [Rosellinia necatrix]